MSRGAKTIAQAAIVLAVALLFAVARPFFPAGIRWNGQWPSSATSTEQAYRMFAKAGDPPFVSLSEALDFKDKATFIDARSADLFKQGHIPKSRNLPFYEMDAFTDEAIRGLNDQSVVIVYCEGVGCELSFLLGRELQKMGFKDVRIFYGGWPEWTGAGLPVEK